MVQSGRVYVLLLGNGDCRELHIAAPHLTTTASIPTEQRVQRN